MKPAGEVPAGQVSYSVVLPFVAVFLASPGNNHHLPSGDLAARVRDDGVGRVHTKSHKILIRCHQKVSVRRLPWVLRIACLSRAGEADNKGYDLRVIQYTALLLSPSFSFPWLGYNIPQKFYIVNTGAKQTGL